MNFLQSIPESIFEIIGFSIGFFVCIITAIQIIKEYKSKQSSSLSPGYVMGWLFVYSFWALYGLRFEAIALWTTNSLALLLQIGLCVIVFKKNKKIMDLGIFSISLAVKDIKTSKHFYEKLGFTMIDGNLDQKWAILKNGTSKIGLFQGMFPNNTLTFNSENVRDIYKKINGEEITVTMSNGMDKNEGPASFMITDPDGNPILVDQY